MKITSAEFVKSVWKPSDYPGESLPEVAFAGKSNVGKSSLINVLVNRKKLVKTSATPGKTQSVNFFTINNTITFVDLPGYGFAKVPPAVRKKWKPLVEGYLESRRALKLALLILDIRRTPSQEDIGLLDWFDFHQIPSIVVLNKVDKLSKSKVKRQSHIITESLPLETNRIVPFSAVTREGKGEIWKRILAGIGKIDAPS